MVNIHVRREDNGDWIHGLKIPLEDIERLSRRPLKWLRFVTFAVLGAKGDLLDAPDGNIVHYETVSFADLAESYYFFPDGRYHLIDSTGLADYITSSISTPRRSTFRHDVAQHDNNRCVITDTPGVQCHAAHIISHSKGGQYIHLVISGRRSLYEDEQINDIEIDSTENGMLLTPDLHGRFGLGGSAFLKTPNFALKPDDIPRVEPGDTPASRTTIQHLGGPGPRSAHAPPSILLDYMYGVAIIQRWATEDIEDLLEKGQETYYKIANKPSSIRKDDDDVQPGPADSQTSEYVPGQTRGIHQTRTEAAQCRAIDNAFAFSMFIKGYPPGTMLLQKQEEEAEMRSRQVSREKVQGWLDTSESFPLSHGSDLDGGYLSGYDTN
ncbi:hypothetical protein L210DRAFT_3651316 [Boletus edulis BED1]|uniref:HNH nuclease domain-containing protein n=1 Tax=Boletus edulis BED1 TaxID=1328754 RepID=A0AAD4BHX9_BOLED|nr:hypothetical protein L210DRAFT_3651316 [Boletus edulis BED1]